MSANFKKYPKVLVISHNPFCIYQNNGKTISSIFKSWPSNKIRQLYFSSEMPNSSICQDYFRLSDADQVKSLFKIFSLKGKSFKLKEDLIPSNETKSGILSFLWEVIPKKNSFMLILRDILWNLRGKTDESLDEWIDDFNPDIIFFVASNSVFSYEIAIELRDKLNIPLVPFFTDDYIMPNGSYNPFAYFQRKRVTKRFKNIISSSSEMFVIGELMMEEYSSKFGKKFSIVSNYPQSNKIILPKKVRENDEPLKLIYSGNIELGRFKKLLDIAYAIEKLSKIGLNINLYIYSLQKPLRNDLKKINELSSTKFMGSLQDSDKIKNTIKEADIVLHVESDKKKFKKITKYSVSTKISEYLSYSKCILAYGPHDIASMSYLEKYKSALICHDKKDVYDKLYKIYKDRNIQIYYENKAMELFKLKKNTLVVEDIIISAANQ